MKFYLNLCSFLSLWNLFNYVTFLFLAQNHNFLTKNMIVSKINVLLLSWDYTEYGKYIHCLQFWNLKEQFFFSLIWSLKPRRGINIFFSQYQSVISYWLCISSFCIISPVCSPRKNGLGAGAKTRHNITLTQTSTINTCQHSTHILIHGHGFSCSFIFLFAVQYYFQL